ncbi:MAG: FAD:protein FMN transferase [Planctomycetota bacterium]|nr:FAD:protein FMN transferase [Planctomycetota bacterium]
MQFDHAHHRNPCRAAFSRRRFMTILGGLAASRAACDWLGRPQPALGMEPVGMQCVERTGRALGSVISMAVLHADRNTAQKAIAAAFAQLDQVDQLMSIYRPDSQISRLNRTASLPNPHPWVLEVLRKAQSMSQQSTGAFDITVQPLWDLYAGAQKQGRLPVDAAIQAALAKVNWCMLEVSADRIALPPGMSITLNGIAQGYAADRVAAALQQHGIRHALVNTGEIGAIGRRSDGQQWTVGIQHPRSKDAYVALARLEGRFMATSGDYETTFSKDREYNHIFDPASGRSPRVFSSVTIVAKSGADADALSTAVFVLGHEEGLRLIENTPGAEALLVLKDGRTLATNAFPSATL